MPLIDLKSNLAATATRVLNNTERRVEDSSKLLKLLASGKGATFAAKQALLDPKAATKRLASITAQLALNSVPFGVGGSIGFDTNKNDLSNSVEGTAEENSGIRDIKSKYQDLFIKEDRSYVSEYPTQLDVRAKYEVKDHAQTSYTAEEQDLLNNIDTVPFYFTTYQLDGGQVTNGFSLAFPAFFNSISDSVNGNWSSFSYTGRGEQFHVYQMYGRSLTMNFKVAALSERDLAPLYSKLESLRSFTAPTYTDLGYMRGTLLKTTIGSFVKGLPGFATNISYGISDNVPWEIANRDYILPHVVDVQVGFTVIEPTTPQLTRPRV